MRDKLSRVFVIRYFLITISRKNFFRNRNRTLRKLEPILEARFDLIGRKKRAYRRILPNQHSRMTTMPATFRFNLYADLLRDSRNASTDSTFPRIGKFHCSVKFLIEKLLDGKAGCVELNFISLSSSSHPPFRVISTGTRFDEILDGQIAGKIRQLHLSVENR